MSCPYSLAELAEALWYLYDQILPQGMTADEIWDGIEDIYKPEITDYFGRPDGVQ